MNSTEELAITIGYFALVFTVWILLDWKKEKSFHKDILDRAKMMTHQLLEIKKEFSELKQSDDIRRSSIMNLKNRIDEVDKKIDTSAKYICDQIDETQEHVSRARLSIQKLARNQNRLRNKMQTKTIKIEGTIPVLNKSEVDKVQKQMKEFEA